MPMLHPFPARATLGVSLLTIAMVATAAAGSLDLPVRGAGLSFGNSRTFTGLRFNLSDRDLQTIRGVSVTLWAPADEPTGRIQGLSLGLAGTAADEIDGVTLNLLGCGADRVRGVAVAGLGAGGESLTGVALAGGGLHADRFAGLAACGAYLRGDVLKGVGVGAYNRFDVGVQGLQIGIVNHAAELHGVQIGLLNHAGNNRRGARWLPLLNLHLGD